MGLADKAQVENPNVVDLNMNTIEKKEFRINGDNNRVLKLHTSDTNIIPRLNKGYKELNNLVQEMTALNAEDIESEEDFEKLAEQLQTLDKKMREQLDYIFDSNVSEVCAPVGSMCDLKDGKFQFEHILESLAPLYEKAFTTELGKLRQNVTKHTAKYTKSRKRK